MSLSKIFGCFFLSLAAVVAISNFRATPPHDISEDFWKPENYEKTKVNWLTSSHGTSQNVTVAKIKQLSVDGRVVHVGVKQMLLCLKRDKKTRTCKEQAEDPVIRVSYATKLNHERDEDGGWTTTWAVNNTDFALKHPSWRSLTFSSKIEGSLESFSATRTYTRTSWLLWIIFVILVIVGLTTFSTEELKEESARTKKD